MIAGRISDRIGRRPVILAGVSAQFLSYAMVFFKAYEEPMAYVMLTALLGIADSCWNTQPGAIIGTFFRENSVSAFANYRLFQSAGVSLSFAYYSLLSTESKAWICIATGTISIICLQTLHTFVQSLDKSQKA
jgi:MFS family permease